MGRIKKCFNRLGKSKALVVFITAGDPDLETTVEMIPLLEKMGADIVELGIPFSDPMADGPVIQLSSERALASGTDLSKILDCVRKAREKTEVPIVLMGYLNPVHAYGYERFARDAAAAGVDGVLLVDMPPEEGSDFLEIADRAGLDTIFLLAPTSDHDRISAVSGMARGFVYYVTVTGVTGERAEVSGTLDSELSAIRNVITVPVVAGFGISTPEQAAAAARMADGVVVGSAVVRLFEKYSGEKLGRETGRFVASLKEAVNKSK